MSTFTLGEYHKSVFRKIDIDDFFILSCMLEGMSVQGIRIFIKKDCTCIAKRIRKIERVLPEAFQLITKEPVEGGGRVWSGWQRKRVLTEKGREIAAICRTFLEQFDRVVQN